jgi:pimeloyl-ACP methyl ester carboxylesterase
VLVWHGRHDRFVPVPHGEWLAARIPGAQGRISDEDGHLTLLTRRVPEVHAWLVARF